MKKITLLLTLLLSLVGVTKAETLTANFNSGLPEGWSIVGDLNRNSDRARSGSGVWTSSKSDNANYLITEAVEGSITFYARAYNKNTAAYVFIYAYDGSALGEQLYMSANMRTSSTPSFSSYTANLGSYKGQVAIALNYTAIDDVTYTQKEATEGPALTVKDGSTKLTSPYAYNFGLTTAGTTKTFTLSNPGTADLGVSVSETGNFAAQLSAATIAAGSEVTLTVTMPEATGNSTITISSTTDSIDDFVFNVSGTVRDANKVYLDFSDGKIPDGWTSTQIGSYGSAWSASEGYVSQSGSSSSYEWAFTSPKLNFEQDETIFFETAKYNSSSWYTPSIKVQYSTDGNEWTTIGTEFTDDTYGNWTSRSVTIPVSGVKYLRFSGWYVHLRNIYGGEEPNEPNFKFTASDYTFGMISAGATSSEFTLTNSGKGEQTGVSVTCDNDNFVVSDVETTIAAKSTATFTITMKADVKGAQSGTVTVKADGVADITFNVSGYVLDTDVIVVDFAENTVPEGWTNSGFSVSNSELSTTYNTRTLNSPAITVAEGQKLAIYAKGGSTYYARLTVKTSTDNGSTWKTAKEFTTELRNNTTDYVVLTVDNIEAGNYLLQLEGYYVTINTINGYTYNMNAPVMNFTGEDFAAGKVTANASKTYSVSNSGTGTLTVNITSDDEKFTVSPAQLVITEEAKEFTVTFNYEEGVYGKFNGNITVTPTYDESAAVTFAASAQVVDPNVWEEDFEEGTLPTGWVATTWTVGTFSSYENKTKMALAPSGSSAGTLTTPCLTAKEGDVLTWDGYFNWYDEAMTVEYSSDNQETWTKIYDAYKAQDDFGSTRYTHKEMSFTAPADGNYYLRFSSTYQNGVDNFSGFKLNLPDHIMAITTSSIPSSSHYYMTMKESVSFNATVTLAESRGVDEEVTAKFYMGDEVIGSTTETVEANSSKVITIVCTPTKAATEGAEMHIEVEWAGSTLTTEAVTRYVAAVTRLDLAEGADTEITTSTTFDVITLTRNFNAGWNTFITPLSVNLNEFGEGAKAYSFTGYADGALSFSIVTDTSLNPATPYIIYVPEKMENKVFTWENTSISSMYVGEENIRTTQNNATFQGTYAPIAAGDLTGKYGVTPDGHIRKAGASASVKGFRAYFDLPAGAEVKALFFEDDATSIASTLKETKEGVSIYNLSGQRISRMQKGINIINGKKILK